MPGDKALHYMSRYIFITVFH